LRATIEGRAVASRALVAKANARALDLAPIIDRLDPDGSLLLTARRRFLDRAGVARIKARLAR
jgi:hypothetical protein